MNEHDVPSRVVNYGYELLAFNGLIKTGVLVESVATGMNGRPLTHILLAQ